MATATITWRDAQEMPEDGRRYEAVGGKLYVTAAPSFRHQRICHRLQVKLHDLLEVPGHGVVAAGPVGVEFPATEEGVQPDLVYVSEERRGVLADNWIRGAPDLVIEILSPSTEDRDRRVKLKLYRRQGVAQYWAVDPQEDAVEVWRFRAGSSEGDPSHQRFTDRLPVRIDGQVVGEIDLTEIFVRES